jgi:hypothetical protein
MRGQGTPTRAGPLRQVLGGVGGHHSAAEGRNMLLGNACLLLNTLAMALYYLTCAAPRAARARAGAAGAPPAGPAGPPSWQVLLGGAGGAERLSSCRMCKHEPSGLITRPGCQKTVRGACLAARGPATGILRRGAAAAAGCAAERPLAAPRRAKQLVGLYPAMCIAAWAYITAALAMGATALLFVERSGWEVPGALAGPLAYWIIVCSVAGYYVVTWATQHLPASQARRRPRGSARCGPAPGLTATRRASAWPAACALWLPAVRALALHAPKHPCAQSFGMRPREAHSWLAVCPHTNPVADEHIGCCERRATCVWHRLGSGRARAPRRPTCGAQCLAAAAAGVVREACPPPATAAAHGARARAQVASFQCLQPFVGTLLAFAVLGEEPSAWDLGAVGVLLGLVLVVSDKHDLQARAPWARARDRALLGRVLVVGNRRDLQARTAAGADWLCTKQVASARLCSASSALSVPARAEGGGAGPTDGVNGARRRARQRWWAACGAS